MLITLANFKAKKDIYNLPTSVVLRNNNGNHFNIASFATLPRAEKLLLYYEFFVTKFFLC